MLILEESGEEYQILTQKTVKNRLFMLKMKMIRLKT